MKENIQLLIKPASSGCNEHCSYCFYADEAAERSTPDFGIMNSDAAEALIRKAFEYADSSCDFIFQGGEPLLAGTEFFKSFKNTADRLNAEMKRNKPLSLSWAIQTNGSLIDDETALFFKEAGFLIGVSVDGPGIIHDSQRGSGSFDRTMAGIEILKKHQIPFNVLCVVTEDSSRHAEEIYEFFKANKFDVQQYIPCLAPISREGKCTDSAASRSGDNPPDYSPSPESWGRFLCDIFDLWEEDIKAGRNISVRYFENIARVLLGMPPESCGMAGRCSVQFTAEANGDIYPCDFYALDEYRLGNIKNSGFEEMENSDTARAFSAPYAVSAACADCRYYRLCRGGCRRERRPQTPGLTGLCKGYLMFFEHSADRLWALLSGAGDH